MRSIMPIVIEKEKEYRDFALKNRLHKFLDSDVIGDDKFVQANEMEALYTQRMVKKGSPGRHIYDKLISLPPHGKCPLCGHRTVSTLDHYLPKSRYLVLAVTPLNLVPACSDCNKFKSSIFPSCSEEALIHPYFDNIESDKWLFADVCHTSPATVRFRLNKPDSWGEVLFDRLIRHFKNMKLGCLYAAQAADELLHIHHQLLLIYNSGGASAVRQEMIDRAESCRKININSWRTATFEAFSNSDWFCDKGFDNGIK